MPENAIGEAAIEEFKLVPDVVVNDSADVDGYASDEWKQDLG